MNINLNPSTLELIVSEKDIQFTDNNSLTGIVYWRLEDNCFPGPDWSDFSARIIGWWTGEVSHLLDGSSIAEELNFMEGPYSILCNTNENKIHCSFINSYASFNKLTNNYTRFNKVQIDWTGNTTDLGRIILKAADKLLQICFERKFFTDELIELDGQVKRLRNLLKLHHSD